MTPNLKLVQADAFEAKRRKIRAPSHPFNLRQRPWQVVPFFFAPVLPGETMQSLNWMAKVRSQPVKHPLIGWWYETAVFYVKHSQMTLAPQLTAMMLTASTDLNTTHGNAVAKRAMFHAAGGLPVVQDCYDKVIEWYFRDADEAINVASLDDYYLAQHAAEGWWDSARLQSDASPSGHSFAEHELPGDNPVVPDGAPSGFATHFDQWEKMRALGLTKATYEDYLRANGVNVPEQYDEELGRPELLRKSKQFTHPSIRVDDEFAGGYMVDWSLSEEASKARFFSEPGFLIGVSVARPKVYLSNVVGTMAGFMGKPFHWAPKALDAMPFLQLEDMAASAGPAPQAFTSPMWVDLRDYLIHGEPLVNHTNYSNGVAGITSAGLNKYGSAAEADALFSDPAKNWLESDGIVIPRILTRLGEDTSI